MSSTDLRILVNHPNELDAPYLVLLGDRNRTTSYAFSLAHALRAARAFLKGQQ